MSIQSVTEEEKKKILDAYFKNGHNGKLENLPRKEKRKRVVLEHLVKRLDSKAVYSEQELNEELKMFYSDFATIRRYLIDYGFMERSRDGKEYRVNA